MTIANDIVGHSGNELEDFGQLADGVASVLWRVSRGSSSRSEPLLARAESVLRDIGEQLTEAYFARPNLPLGDALFLANPDVDEKIEARRIEASQFFVRLSDALADVQNGGGSNEDVRELAQVFSLLGASTSDARNRPMQSQEGKWVTT
jgi:hypothetical protein